MGAVNPQALRSWQEKYAKLEIDVEQFLQNSHITVVGGNIRSAADAAGTVFDIAQTINEQRRGQALGQLYHRMYDEACAQLQNGSIDGYEARLFELLALMTNMDMPADQLATFRIIVNSAPGLTREAAQCMPEAVPLLFGRQATAMIYLMLSRVFFHRQRVELLSQIIRQQGDRGFSLCFLSRSWSARRTPGFLILNGPTVRGISWMLDSHLGAVHEHTNDLDIVCRTWSFLLGADDLAMARVDRHTVEQIQSHGPANCQQDRDFLQPIIETGLIFRQFDLAGRDAICQGLLTHRRLLPSLHTFFKDLKYLEDLACCVSRLVQPFRRQTIRQAFREAFAGNPTSRNFDLAYRRVWLFAMRCLDDLHPKSLRVESRDRIKTRKKSVHAEHDFAREADRLGFQSEKTDRLLASSSDYIEAREALLRARPPGQFALSDERKEDMVYQIVRLFDQAQPKVAPTDQSHLIINGSDDADMERRCGRPYRLAFEESAAFMSLEHVHVIDSTEIGGPSTFCIRRNVYLLFFGLPEDQDMDHRHGALGSQSDVPAGLRSRSRKEESAALAS